MAFSDEDRVQDSGCLCCGSVRLQHSSAAVSPFLAHRAWRGKAKPTELITCCDCGFRFFRRGLSDQEAARYYAGYYDDKYCTERYKYEPFFTRKTRDASDKWAASQERRDRLTEYLASAGLDPVFDSVCDYGGGRGSLIREIQSPHKAVLDISGGAVEDGVESISRSEFLATQWHLIVCAHVLEHVSSPRATLKDIFDNTRSGGSIYVEVPNQTWRSSSLFGPSKRLTTIACHSRYLFLACDVYGAAFRTIFGVLPPLAFVPMREHLQFFTQRALEAVVKRTGFTISLLRRQDSFISGHNYASGVFAVVATKP